jgi:hypothetical protein
MKRTTRLAALLLLACAAACAPAPSTNSTNATNTNAANSNAANANAASAPAWTEENMIAGERRAWDAIKAKDFAAFSDMLAPEFVDVTPDGDYDKNATVENLRKITLTDVSLTDFRVVRIDGDAAVVTYKENSKGTYDGKPLPPGSFYHTSVLAWRGGKWVALFHQVTAEEPPLPPTLTASSPTPSASATATAAATPAATTADVEANERLVWDALKRKDWTAFAGYLADDALEVWGTGVSNKAQSVESVKQIDFSTFTQSDFKTIPIDADAKIVVYTIKGTFLGKPFNNRSSSVWAARGGRWLAVFHQGTEVAPPAR